MTTHDGEPIASHRHRRTGRLWPWITGAFWLAGAVAGLAHLARYDNTAGAVASAPQRWPADTRLARAVDRPTLIFLAHPKCSCTRAGLAELAEVLARADRVPDAIVLFVKPSGVADGWEQTDLWRTAASIPGVRVVLDDGGIEAARFGVWTSGQSLLYQPDGALVFSGGITGARGHAGNNAGRAALLDILDRRRADHAGTRVFGCPLRSTSS